MRLYPAKKARKWLDYAFDALVRLVGTGARPSTASLGLSGFLEGVDPRAACCALRPLYKKGTVRPTLVDRGVPASRASGNRPPPGC